MADCTILAAHDCVCSQHLGWARPGASHEEPCEGGSGSVGNAATAFHGAPHPAAGPTFLGKALPRPARLHHSASLRLALQPKNRTLHSVQLPDLELSDVGQGMF